LDSYDEYTRDVYVCLRQLSWSFSFGGLERGATGAAEIRATGACPEAPRILTVIAIPSSGEPPKSVGIPMRILGICIATMIGLTGIFVVSYFNMSRGVAALTEAKDSSETALEQALAENEILRLEKQERLAQIGELADKAKLLETAMNQIANEKARYGP